MNGFSTANSASRLYRFALLTLVCILASSMITSASVLAQTGNQPAKTSKQFSNPNLKSEGIILLQVENDLDFTKKSLSAAINLSGKLIYVGLAMAAVLLLFAIWGFLRSRMDRRKSVSLMRSTMSKKEEAQRMPFEIRLDNLIRLTERTLSKIGNRRFLSFRTGFFTKQVNQIRSILEDAKRLVPKTPPVMESQSRQPISDLSLSAGKRLDSMESKLDTIIQLVQNLQTPQIPIQPTQPGKGMQKYLSRQNNSMQEFCSLYNKAVRNSSIRDEFMQQYNPIRIGVTNSMERRRDSRIVPDFRTADRGDYFAVPIEGSKLYAVVPSLGLAFQEFNYGPGAMELVFECPGYDPKFRYRNVEVVEPAYFEADNFKKQWSLNKRGKLNLGQGE